MKKLYGIFFFLLSLSVNAQYWKQLGGGKEKGAFNPFIFTLYTDTIDDLLYVGGKFTQIDDVDSVPGMVTWNGTKFIEFGLTTR